MCTVSLIFDASCDLLASGTMRAGQGKRTRRIVRAVVADPAMPAARVAAPARPPHKVGAVARSRRWARDRRAAPLGRGDRDVHMAARSLAVLLLLGAALLAT